MTVTIHYFAMLREQARCDEETRQTPAATVAALYAELAGAYNFTVPANALRAAVNDVFVTMDAALKNGDEVTFIPPVAGG